MAKKKTPKPNPRMAQLWMGIPSKRTRKISYACAERFRVLYPDGRTEWTSTSDLIYKAKCHLPNYLGDDRGSKGYVAGFPEKWFRTPCWQYDRRLTSFAERVKAMRAYDRKNKRTTMFLGNL